MLLRRHGVPTGIGLLHDILSIGQGAEESVREIDQLTSLAHDRAQAWIGPAVSWLGVGSHVASGSLGRICLTSSAKHRT